jgi:hypothetical protein
LKSIARFIHPPGGRAPARRRIAGACLAAALLAAAGCGGSFSEGVTAYREGRVEDALRLFAKAEEKAGERASPELCYDHALAALRTGDWVLAESEVEKAAARGGEEFTALRDFLAGNTAFARCQAAESAAEAETEGPEAVFTYYDAAVGHAILAAGAWRRAAASKPDWPEARRNLERALLKCEALKQKMEEARQRQADARKRRIEVPIPLPLPGEAPQAEEGEKTPEPVDVQAQRKELSSSALERLMEKLGDKEKEKRELRKNQRHERSDVEKDW